VYIEYTCVLILASDPQQLIIPLRCCNVLKVATSGQDKDLIVRVHGFYDVGPAFDRLFQLGEEVSDEVRQTSAAAYSPRRSACTDFYYLGHFQKAILLDAQLHVSIDESVKTAYVRSRASLSSI